MSIRETLLVHSFGEVRSLCLQGPLLYFVFSVVRKLMFLIVQKELLCRLSRHA